MPKVSVADRSGDTMTLLDVDGYYLPVIKVNHDQEQGIRSIMKDAKARADDIIICAYPKSGTHWVWEIAGMLLNGKADRIQGIKEMAMLETMTCDDLDKMTSPRILNTHVYYSQIADDFKKKQCKVVYITRNPKDVAVSFFNHHLKLIEYNYTGQWKNYLQRFMDGKVDYGSWFDYVLEWNKDMKDNQQNPAHVVSYEDVQENCVHEIKRLADFLNVDGNIALYEKIAEQCSFSKMKKEKDPMEDTSYWKDKTPCMYRKGKVGDWKNWFTINQNEMFNGVFENKFKECPIPIISRTYQE